MHKGTNTEIEKPVSDFPSCQAIFMAVGNCVNTQRPNDATEAMLKDNTKAACSLTQSRCNTSVSES